MAQSCTLQIHVPLHPGVQMVTDTSLGDKPATGGDPLLGSINPLSHFILKKSENNHQP